MNSIETQIFIAASSVSFYRREMRRGRRFSGQARVCWMREISLRLDQIKRDLDRLYDRHTP
jgi:hypothetical protein